MAVTAQNTITVLIKRLNHGGAEKVCVALCNELIMRGYTVELWVVDATETILSKQLNKHVKVTGLNKKHVRQGVFPLLTLLLHRKPKQLLIFNIELAILTLAIKKMFFLNTKIIVRSINTLSQVFLNPESQRKRKYTYQLIKYFLPFSNMIIAQSKGMKEDLMENFQIESNQIKVIHNPAFNIIPNELNGHDDKIIVNEFLYIGRLQPQKGLENLIHIFYQAYKKYPDMHLTIVGEGPEEGILKKLTESLGLSSCISFQGYNPNTINLYRKAKATVLTSLYEGFPNVLVESIAVGTPVIAFDCPSGPSDIIIEGVNGILVPNLDKKAFSSALIAVATNEIKFEKKKVIKTAQKFSMNTIINQYEEVFGGKKRNTDNGNSSKSNILRPTWQ